MGFLPRKMARNRPFSYYCGRAGYDSRNCFKKQRDLQRQSFQHSWVSSKQQTNILAGVSEMGQSELLMISVMVGEFPVTSLLDSISTNSLLSRKFSC